MHPVARISCQEVTIFFSRDRPVRQKQRAVGSTKQREEMTMMFDDTIKLYATPADDDKHYGDEAEDDNDDLRQRFGDDDEEEEGYGEIEICREEGQCSSRW